MSKPKSAAAVLYNWLIDPLAILWVALILVWVLE